LKSPFHGDLLRRLSVPTDRIEVVFDTNDWHLPRQVAKDWKALEIVLALATKNLLSFFGQNHPKTHLAFTPPNLPSTYGYFDTHKSEAAARSALSVSLDAFAVYLGYFSFIVAICQFGIDPQSCTINVLEGVHFVVVNIPYLLCLDHPSFAPSCSLHRLSSLLPPFL
jgi:hypothetical protein